MSADQQHDGDPDAETLDTLETDAAELETLIDVATGGADLATRQVRALAEADRLELVEDAEALYRVYSLKDGEQGDEYIVEPNYGACTCPDHRYRDVRCKHLHLADLASGNVDPAAVDGALDDTVEMIDDRIAFLRAARDHLQAARDAIDDFDGGDDDG